MMANDGNDEYNNLIVSNLSQVPVGSGDETRWKVTHSEANRVMTECYLQRDYFDVIDVDSFGSDSTFLRSALCTLKLGGLLYVTCTDGFSSGGHRPYHCLAAYGAYVRSVPFCNEIGLRMLIGGAVREASVLGYHVTPLFSYYSFHGPVFRVMLRFGRGKLRNNSEYGFIGYCRHCGHSQVISWDDLGSINCPCNATNVSGSLVIIGPLWTGPLHNGTYISEMLNLAQHWGWTNSNKVCELEKLLRRMIDESNPLLPPGYTDLDEVAKRAKVNSPPLMKMMDIMHKEGYVASRSHIALNALKTNCPMAECMRIARELDGAE